MVCYCVLDMAASSVLSVYLFGVCSAFLRCCYVVACCFMRRRFPCYVRFFVLFLYVLHVVLLVVHELEIALEVEN